MKSIYCYECFIYSEGHTEDFTLLSRSSNYFLMSPEQVLEKTSKEYFDNFEDFFDVVQNNKFHNCQAYITPYLKHFVVSVNCIDYYFNITERDFKKVCIQHSFKEIQNPSIKFLMENLSVDDFIEYLKEKGIDFSKIV